MYKEYHFNNIKKKTTTEDFQKVIKLACKNMHNIMYYKKKISGQTKLNREGEIKKGKGDTQNAL